MMAKLSLLTPAQLRKAANISMKSYFTDQRMQALSGEIYCMSQTERNRYLSDLMTFKKMHPGHNHTEIDSIIQLLNSTPSFGTWR